MKLMIRFTLLNCFFLQVAPAQGTKSALEGLIWMAGCWETKVQDRIIEEQWMKPQGHMMLGMGRTILNGKTVFFEFLQIVQSDSGTFYIARPRGGRSTPFKRVKIDGNEVVFENLLHDFPHRIIYRRETETSLFARVEGTVKGELRSEEFRYQRSPCE